MRGIQNEKRKPKPKGVQYEINASLVLFRSPNYKPLYKTQAKE